MSVCLQPNTSLMRKEPYRYRVEIDTDKIAKARAKAKKTHRGNLTAYINSLIEADLNKPN